MVELGAAGGVFCVGGVEAELDGLAEGVGGSVEPVGLALGWAKHFDNHGFRAVHKCTIAQTFYSVKSNRRFPTDESGGFRARGGW